jgi:hypothetical protein
MSLRWSPRTHPKIVIAEIREITMRRQSRRSQRQYREEILGAVFRFLLAVGVSTNELERDIAEALAKSVQHARHRPPPQSIGITALGSILHRWHHQRRYLDARAQPIALRLRGRSPSFESLVRSEGLGIQFRQIFSEMKELRLVRRSRCGYVPTKYDAIVSRYNPMVVEYTAVAITRMLSTIANNTDPQKKVTFIERSAFVADLKKQHFDEFCRFAHSQGEALVSALNDWLEARRAFGAARRRGDIVPAGVHVYAFSKDSIV